MRNMRQIKHMMNCIGLLVCVGVSFTEANNCKAFDKIQEPCSDECVCNRALGYVGDDSNCITPYPHGVTCNLTGHDLHYNRTAVQLNKPPFIGCRKCPLNTYKKKNDSSICAPLKCYSSTPSEAQTPENITNSTIFSSTPSEAHTPENITIGTIVIAGIVVGCVAMIGIFVLVACCLYKRRRGQQLHQRPQPEHTNGHIPCAGNRRHSDQHNGLLSVLSETEQADVNETTSLNGNAYSVAYTTNDIISNVHDEHLIESLQLKECMEKRALPKNFEPSLSGSNETEYPSSFVTIEVEQRGVPCRPVAQVTGVPQQSVENRRQLQTQLQETSIAHSERDFISHDEQSISYQSPLSIPNFPTLHSVASSNNEEDHQVPESEDLEQTTVKGVDCLQME